MVLGLAVAGPRDDAAHEVDLRLVGKRGAGMGDQRVLAGAAWADDGDEGAVADRMALACSRSSIAETIMRRGVLRARRCARPGRGRRRAPAPGRRGGRSR